MGFALKKFLSRGAAFLAILALALIPAAAQPPRATNSIEKIEIRSQAIETFDPRELGFFRPRAFLWPVPAAAGRPGPV